MPILSLTLSTAIALGSAGAASHHAKPALAGVAAELSAVNTRLAEAMARRDIDAVLALYADDAVLMEPNNLVARSKEEIRRSYLATFANLEDIKLEIWDGHYGASGDVGYGFGLFSVQAREVHTGKPVEWRGRASSVMVKHDGKWLFRLDHASLPRNPPPDPAGTVRIE